MQKSVLPLNPLYVWKICFKAMESDFFLPLELYMHSGIYAAWETSEFYNQDFGGQRPASKS